MYFSKKSLELPVHGQVTYLFTTPLGSETPAKFQIHKIAKIADDFYVPLKGYASDP